MATRLLALKYRVIQHCAVNLDLLAGARLWMMDMNLTLTGPLAVRRDGRSESWIDPVVGVAGRVKLGGGVEDMVDSHCGRTRLVCRNAADHAAADN